MLGLVNAYVNPMGQHVFFVNDPCRNFDDVTYYDTMLVHFLATNGADIYDVTHPVTHKCMATQTCPFPIEFSPVPGAPRREWVISSSGGMRYFVTLDPTPGRSPGSSST